MLGTVTPANKSPPVVSCAPNVFKLPAALKSTVGSAVLDALRLGVSNPWNTAEPVIDAIKSLIEVAPLSLEDLPDIENPFRTAEPTVDLSATGNLNTIGAQLTTGGDLLAGVTVPNTGQLPFDQLKNNQQKIAKGQSIFKDDITFGG